MIVHGNGPQVGMLALQAGSFPLDVLDAETEGMIGYMIEQEMRNLLPAGRACVSLLSMVEVSASDPAFEHPDKPIGSRYAVAEAAVASQGKGWTVTAQGDKLQRVVPSPKPVRMLEIEPVRWLLEHSCVVICAGGRRDTGSRRRRRAASRCRGSGRQGPQRCDARGRTEGGSVRHRD